MTAQSNHTIVEQGPPVNLQGVVNCGRCSNLQMERNRLNARLQYEQDAVTDLRVQVATVEAKLAVSEANAANEKASRMLGESAGIRQERMIHELCDVLKSGTTELEKRLNAIRGTEVRLPAVSEAS